MAQRVLVFVSIPRTVHIERDVKTNSEQSGLKEESTSPSQKAAKKNVKFREKSTPEFRLVDPTTPTSESAQRYELDLEGDLIQLLHAHGLEKTPLFHDKDSKAVQVTATVDGAKVEGFIMDLLHHGIGKFFGTVNCTQVDFSRHPEHKQEPPAEEPAVAGDLGGASVAVSEQEDETVQSVLQRRSTAASNCLIVDQIVRSTKASAGISFDFICLVVIAAILAAIGLHENSSVVVVSSMLISPMMNPVLGAVLGTVTRSKALLLTGIRTCFLTILMCIAVGCSVGIIFYYTEDHDQFNMATLSKEIVSRGDPKGLRIGVAIAIVSGFGVALSLLGRNTNSLVGVAISASLLPPAVNSGMVFVYAFLTPTLERTDVLRIAGFSLCLTLLNIGLIYVCALLMFWIKRVAPIPNKARLWQLDFAQVKQQREDLQRECMEHAEDPEHFEVVWDELCQQTVEMNADADWLSTQRIESSPNISVKSGTYQHITGPDSAAAPRSTEIVIPKLMLSDMSLRQKSTGLPDMPPRQKSAGLDIGPRQRSIGLHLPYLNTETPRDRTQSDSEPHTLHELRQFSSLSPSEMSTPQTGRLQRRRSSEERRSVDTDGGHSSDRRSSAGSDPRRPKPIIRLAGARDPRLQNQLSAPATGRVSKSPPGNRADNSPRSDAEDVSTFLQQHSARFNRSSEVTRSSEITPETSFKGFGKQSTEIDLR